jgi:type IV pilus assembly protein PilC
MFKPTRFTWSAHDLQGTQHRGELTAASAQAARTQLQQAGWLGIEIRRLGHPIWSEGRRLGPRDITTLTRQLATLVNADVPLLNALSLMTETATPASMRGLLEQLVRDIRGGRSLAQALAEHPRLFDGLYRHVVAAGESSGSLGVLLERLATQRERQEALRAQLRSAMVYPLAVLLVACAVVVVILVWVVPTFESVYASFGASLPSLTLGLLSLSRATLHHWPLIGTGLMLTAVMGSRLGRTAWISHTWDRWTLHWPVVGELRRRASTARWTRTVSTLLDAGTPLNQALISSAGACGHHRFEQASLAMAQAVQEGQTLTAAMKHCGLFAPVVIQLCAMGEASGQLSATLSRSAGLEERELETQLQGLSGLIEPVIILVLGVLIGTTVLALYWPIFELGQVI